jgi:membrane protease subunit HflK
LNPGFHWTWPRPFSEVVRVPVGRVESLTTASFWHGYGDGAEARQVPPALRPLVDGYTLAGDANLLHSRWTIRFTIDDLERYLFHVQNPRELIARELDRAVMMASARAPVDALLRTELENFRQRVEREFLLRLARVNAGIRVQGVDLVQVAPPLQVAEAFDQVIRAEQEQAQEVTDARAYAVRAINEARGQADQIIAEGETFKTRLIQAIQADADTFQRIQPVVARQPDLMKQVIWQDALREALGTVGQLYVVPSDEKGKREVRLQLSPRRQNPFSEALP